MNKIFILLMTGYCATALKTSAQIHDTTSSRNTPKVDATTLLQKSKSQKTSAIVLLAGGFLLAISGGSIMLDDAADDAAGSLVTIFSLGTIAPEDKKDRAAGPILAIAGTGAMFGSIPLFVASSKNKHKAALMLKNETIFFNPQLNIKHMAAVGLKINL